MTKYYRLPYYFAIGLLIYMPFHIFLSQWLSTFTGGLDFWKVAKDVVLFLAIIMSGLLAYLKNGFKDKLFWLLAGLSVLYISTHLLIWAINPEIAKGPALLGTVYNGRLLGYLLLGFSAAILFKETLDLKKVFKLVLVLSTVVCLIALAQYLLPKDVLTHFGYSLDRGVKPNFFIDDKPDLPRVFSTLRDPNSLGAYLILPLVLLFAALPKLPRARMFLSGLILLHGLILFLTFSRSAWLGAIVAITIVLFWQHKTRAAKFIKKFWPLLIGGLLILVVGVFLAKDQYVIQNVVFHSDESTQQVDSNNLHLVFVQQGVEGVAENPIGHGPGTAGLVSIQTKQVVLTENYFLQIAYEAGLVGLAILLGAIYLVIKQLYKRNDIYGQIMITAFIGLTIPNLLLHTWSNEAVAAQLWILAGLVLYSPLGLASKNSSKTA